jgi:L-lactate dehydrogenase (cytochrome)
MFGRPYLYGLGAAGELGVEWVVDYFASGIKRTMALVGATDVAALRSIVKH